MDRITERDIERLCAEINRRHGFDGQKLWNRIGGENLATVGMFTLSAAYGGWELQQIVTEGGGVHVISHGGHEPKRALYTFMRGYLDGMDGDSA